MRQLESIDEVVEVLEPLEEAVSVSVEALMSETRWDMEKEQQIYVNTDMYDEVQGQLMRRRCLQAILGIIGRKEPDSAERGDDVATKRSK